MWRASFVTTKACSPFVNITILHQHLVGKYEVVVSHPFWEFLLLYPTSVSVAQLITKFWWYMIRCNALTIFGTAALTRPPKTWFFCRGNLPKRTMLHVLETWPMNQKTDLFYVIFVFAKKQWMDGSGRIMAKYLKTTRPKSQMLVNYCNLLRLFLKSEQWWTMVEAWSSNF